MQRFAKSLRLGAVVAALIALIGLSQGQVGAQEVAESATPQAVPTTASPISVSVACAYDEAVNQSTCTFSAVSDTTVVDALIVPAAVICAPVVSSTGTAIDAGGFGAASSVGSPTLSITVQGVAQAGGSASYLVETGGATEAAGGDGIVCGDNSAPEVGIAEEDDPSSTSPTGDVGTEESTSNPGAEGDESAESDEAPVGGTPVAEPAPVTDGTGDPASDLPAAQAEDVQAAALVSIPITAYNCDTVEAAQDPVANCAPAQGVTFDVTVDGQPLPQVVTDATGTAVVDAEEGSAVIVEEVMSTIPTNYVPLGGHQTIDPVAAGTGAQFVHLLVDGQETGNLQIVNGSCPTSDDEPHTEFNVIGPRTLAGAASSCIPTGGALFTIQGALLPGGQLVVQTGSDGSWRGTLPAGDYTVVDDSGSSATLTVEPDSVTVVVVVDYVPQPEGTLTVTRFLCTEGEEEGTTITVDSAPGSGGPGCDPGDGEMRLAAASDGTGGAPEDFVLGDDGEAEFELRTGDYVLTDLATGASATVSVAENAETAATVRQIVLTGRIVVQHIYCDDPSFGDVDPANYAAFEGGCGRPYAGMTLTLSDSGANVVDSETGSGGGIIVWSQLLPDTYSVAGGSDVCAIFAEGADARGGFAVTVGNSTNVEVFSCAPPPSGGDPNDGTGGNTGNNGDLGGAGAGDGTGGGTPSGTGGLYVTQLPDTGVADRAQRSVIWLGFFGSALLLVVAAGVNAMRHRAS